MGIRFNCPNGHKLNVKAELAGKRAICPDCGAKLVVPAGGAASSESSIHQLPSAIRNGNGAINPEGSITLNLEHASVTGPSNEQPVRSAAKGAAPQPVVWYIRPASGGQFGPVADNDLCAWIADGRVTAETYVWRVGWPDWRMAGDAPDELPASLPATALIDPPAIDVPDAMVSDVPIALDAKLASAALAATPSDVLAAVPLTSMRRRKHQTPLFVTILLILTIVVLSGVLIWVIRRNAGSDVSQPQTHRAQLVESRERA